MNCSENYIRRLLPDPRISPILYVKFENPGNYFGFAYKCLMSRLLARWELKDEQVWDNFAVLTFADDEQFFFIPESNFKTVKCVSRYVLPWPEVLRRALLRVAESLSSKNPQFRAKVLLRATTGLIAPEKDVRLAKQFRRTEVQLKYKDSTTNNRIGTFDDFYFSVRGKVDAYLVRVEETQAIAFSLKEILRSEGVHVPFESYSYLHLSHAEASTTMVVLISRQILKLADNPLSDVAEALEKGFNKAPGCVFPLIVESDLLNVDNWPCTPFNLHQIPFIDFSTDPKHEENVEVLLERIKSKLHVQLTRNNSSDI